MSSQGAIELMTRPGCCLCDQAAALVDALDTEGRWALVRVNIAESIELLGRYGNHIPVLRRSDNGEELYWPFDEQDLQGFLSP